MSVERSRTDNRSEGGGRAAVPAGGTADGTLRRPHRSLSGTTTGAGGVTGGRVCCEQRGPRQGFGAGASKGVAAVGAFGPWLSVTWSPQPACADGARAERARIASSDPTPDLIDQPPRTFRMACREINPRTRLPSEYPDAPASARDNQSSAER